MEEVLTAERTENIPDEAVSSGRIYIMDRRAPVQETAPAAELTESEPTPPVCVEAPQQTHRRTYSTRNPRLIACAAACIIGVALGAVVALTAPISAAELSQSAVMSEKGGFAGMLLRRAGQCGAFLIAEYIIGYFAWGGILVWLAPLAYGLGAGLSAAAAFTLGAELLPVLFCAAYAIILSCAANTSGGFSALLLSLVSGRNGSVITDGAAAYHYTLRFILYAALIFALAIAEAWIRTVN